MQNMLEKLIGESKALERAIAGEEAKYARWIRINEI